MQKNLFIANIENLRILANLGHGEKLTDTILITNDRLIIENLLSPSFYEIAGTLEAHYLKTTGAVAYSIEETQAFSNEQTAISFLLGRLGEVKVFMQMLWLVKDNSVNVDLGYLEYPFKTMKLSRTNVSRNSFAHVFTTARGDVLTTEFTRDELRRARYLRRDSKWTVVLTPQVAADERFTRYDRAFYFLQAARGSSDLGVKIANYCTCFETLFSTDSQELSHKLGERIACFLEKDPAERINVFHAIKRAYAIRSKVVHGGKGSSRLSEQLKEVSVSCDNIMRRILIRILDEPSLQKYFQHPTSDKDVEEYFTSLVLGNILSLELNE
jgi:hypothetical protein